MKNFIRKVEDFRCEKCGEMVEGDGYTDHCPNCLWGKHVDLDLPGDRASDCGGLMKPIEAIYTKGRFRIHYRCIRCAHEFWVREGRGDRRKVLLDLAGGNSVV